MRIESKVARISDAEKRVALQSSAAPSSGPTRAGLLVAMLFQDHLPYR